MSKPPIISASRIIKFSSWKNQIRPAASTLRELNSKQYRCNILVSVSSGSIFFYGIRRVFEFFVNSDIVLFLTSNLTNTVMETEKSLKMYLRMTAINFGVRIALSWIFCCAALKYAPSFSPAAYSFAIQ